MTTSFGGYCIFSVLSIIPIVYGKERNIMWAMLEVIFLSMLWSLLLPIILAALPVALLLFLLRSLETGARFFASGAISLRREDLLWMMGNERNYQIISGFLELDGLLNSIDFENLLLQRLVNKRDEKGDRIYPQVTMHLEPGYMDFFWYPDSGFNISDHVIREKCVSDPEKLRIKIGEYVSRNFPDSTKSPWEFILIPFWDKDSGHKKTVVLFRLSHAISDGSSLAYFLIHVLSDNQPKSLVTIKKYTESQRLMFYAKAIFWIPLVYLRLLLHQEERNAIRHSHGSGHRSKKTVSWSKALPLVLLKKKKNELASTVNDVAVGCLAKAVRDHFQKSKRDCNSDDLSTEDTFSAVFAVDTRSNIQQAQIFQNHVAGVVESLPVENSLSVGEHDNSIDEFITKTKHKFDRIKRIGAPIGIYLGWRAMAYLLPLCVLRPFVCKMVGKTTASISNLIGPQSEISICGFRVRSLTFWPPPSGDQSMGISFCSYDNHIRIGVVCDSEALNDLGDLVSLFEENVLALQTENV